MSREQWGHGFFKGAESASGGLVGLYFHSRKDGVIEWQGKVQRKLDAAYLVQLFSWLDGQPTVEKIVPSEDMAGWDFYESDSDMRHAYYKHSGYSSEDVEFSERCVELMKKV